MGDLVHIFGPEGFDPGPTGDAYSQLLDAMREHGLDPGNIIWDGQIHRFGRKKNAWYAAHDDGVPGAAFGDFSTGLHESWRCDMGRELSYEEIEAHTAYLEHVRAAREAEKAQEHTEAAQRAATLWGQSEPATEHPYLAARGIQGDGARVTPDGSLVVPIYSADGELRSVQTITADGDKRFLKGGQVGGCFGFVGTMGVTLHLCEGFADARTIVEATKGGCFFSLSAHNLPAVARHIADMGHSFTLVADNEPTGQKYASRVVADTGCQVITPPAKDITEHKQAGGNVAELLGVGRSWLVSYYDAIRQPSPVRWLVKGVLPRDSLAMVYGPSGLGKTFCVLDLALHIASGRQWYGAPTRHEPVAYLAGEGHCGLASRLAAWEQELGNGHTRLHMSQGGAKLDTQAGLAFVIRELRALPEPPKLIVVDTLHRFLSGDENSAQDAGSMIEACDRLRDEFGSTVLLVHHTGLSGDRARGSSAWFGDLDAQLGLSSDDGEIITATVHKMKDGKKGAKFHGLLADVELPWIDEDGDTVRTKLWRPCEAPVQPMPKVMEADIDKLRRAWWDSGAEVEQDAPYIATAALERFMVTSLGLKESKAARELDPTREGLLGRLAAKGIVTHHAGGWIVTEPTVATAWVVMRG